MSNEVDLYQKMYNGNYQERKSARKEYYKRFVEGFRLVECVACSGSGRYCGRPWGSCDGTGKERRKVSNE